MRKAKQPQKIHYSTKVSEMKSDPELAYRSGSLFHFRFGPGSHLGLGGVYTV